MRIFIAAILLTLTLGASASASSSQVVSGSFQCDVEFVDGYLEASNCEVFDLEFK